MSSFSLRCSDDDEPVNTQVTVKIMDIRWLMKGEKDFLNFVPTLESCKLDKLYQTDFMRSLTHEYWTEYQKKILYGPLLTWTLYSVSCLIYFSEVVLRQDTTTVMVDSMEFGL